MKSESHHKPVVLVAEDDEDHFLLIREAIEATNKDIQIVWIQDGEELMDYLNRQGNYKMTDQSPMPTLMLLDLNMPKKDGREVLEEIKSSEKLRLIPVLILTTSKNYEDIRFCYSHGANTFFRKPSRYHEFFETMKTIMDYWFRYAELPTEEIP